MGGMRILRSPIMILTVSLVYLAGVVLACGYMRLDGSVAMIWVSSGVLAGALVAVDRSRWPALLALCGACNIAGTGFLGLGWAVALPLMAINLAEAVAGATLLRRLVDRYWPRATMEIVSAMLLGTMLFIPVISALCAAGVAWGLVGLPFAPSFVNWWIGHAVGMIVVLPFAAVLMMRLADGQAPFGEHRHLLSVLMVATMLLLCIGVFSQFNRWTLAAPLTFALFCAVWADALVALTMPIIVVAVATAFTIRGIGPLSTGLGDMADRVHAGLLYGGMVSLGTLPIVTEQARRRRELAQLSLSEAHYRAMSERADDLIDELRRAAFTDPLTGLANRRLFFETLRERATGTERACLAMVDIDHFKQVNDRYGHAVGDAVLCHFADLARSTLRSRDFIARIGGEEFAIIIQDTTIEQACQVCQRLLDRLAASPVDTAAGPVSITLSSGVAAVGPDCDASLAAADEALYQAKRDGRSRLVSAA